MRITIADVRKRLKARTQSYKGIVVNEGYLSAVSDIMKTGRSTDIISCIEASVKNGADFYNIMEMFDSLCECGNPSEISKMAHYIAEESAPKVRDASETQTNLRRKLGRIKTKISTKVKGNIEDAKQEINGAAASAKANLKKNVNTLKNNASKIKPGQKKDPKKEKSKDEAVKEGYEEILESVTRQIHCDRIINNYNKMSKRYNLDRLIVENTRMNGVEDTIYQLCRYSDTYAMPNMVKFNTVLESAWYGFKTNSIPVSDDAIVEYATNYFLMKENGLQDCSKILDVAMVFDNPLIPREIIHEEEPENDTPIQMEMFCLATNSDITVNAVVQEKGVLRNLFKDMKAIAKRPSGDPNKDGSYEKLRPWLLGMVEKANTEDRLKYLRDDAYQAVRQLTQLEKNVRDVQNGHPSRYVNVTNIEKRIDHGLTPQKIHAHISWLKSTYIPAINSKLKDLHKAKNEGAALIEPGDEINPDIIENRNDGDDDYGVTFDMDVLDSMGRFIESEFYGEDYLPSAIREETDFNKIFEEYKKKEEKEAGNPSKLRSLINKLYGKSVDNVVEETPKLLSWIRGIIVLGMGAINPILLLIGFIADRFLALHMEREDTEKMLKCFKEEKAAALKKYKTLTDAEEKERMNEYIESLDKAIDKINDAYEGMLTDAELDEKYDKDIDSDMDDLESGDTEIDLDDIDLSEFEDDDFEDFDLEDLDEAVRIIPAIANMMTVIHSNSKCAVPMHKMIGESVENYAKIISKYPQMFDIYGYSYDMQSTLNNISSGRLRLESAMDRYMATNSFYNAIHTINTPTTLMDCDTHNIFKIAEALYYPAAAINAARVVVASRKNFTPIMEASITNKLKMASEKLKKLAQNLSDKDRTVSKNIDVSVNNMKKAVERSLTNDNREAVIKGSILPSASKIVKMALASGVAWMINPAIAVIGVLGYLGTSAKYKAKERQMVLDEIEIELKMCQKYIDIAESKNDMKALKQLLSTQRELQRQQQRIKYKMKVDFNQNVPDVKED